MGIDQGDGAMFHLCGRIAFGMDVGDLLQLQCAFQGNREVDSPAEVKRVGYILVDPGNLFNLLVSASVRSTFSGMRLQFLQQFRVTVKRGWFLFAGQAQGPAASGLPPGR